MPDREKLNGDQRHLMESLSPKTLQGLDELGALIDRGTPGKSEEYTRILQACRSECEKRNVGMAPGQTDSKIDGILALAKAMHERGEIGPRRLRFIGYEVGLMKKAADAGQPYVEPVPRLQRFKMTGRSMKVRSVLLDSEIAVVVSPEDMGNVGSLTPYTPDELILMIQHKLYEDALWIDTVKRVFDGDLISVQGKQA